MKKVFFALFTFVLLIAAHGKANAATFTYIPTDDIQYENRIALNTVGNLRAFDLKPYISSTPYFKFDISNINTNMEKITNVTLKLTEWHRWGTKNPNLGLYFVENDDWNEGPDYLIQGSVDTNIADYAAFNETNRPIIYDQNYLTTNISHSSGSNELNSNFDEWSFSFDNLSDNIKNGFYDGALSLAILDLGGGSYVEFNSKEKRGEIIQIIDQNNTGGYPSMFATVEALQNPYAPQLKIETTPWQAETTPVPEPSSTILGLISLASLIGSKKRNKN